MKKPKINKDTVSLILFISGCVGVAVTAFCAGRDAVKASEVVKEKDIPKFKAVEQTEEIAPGVDSVTGVELVKRKEYYPEVVKTTWKCFIPTAAALTATYTCLIFSKRIDAKHITLLTSAVASGAGLVSKYRDKIKDIYGEAALHDVDRAVAKDEIIHAKSPRITTPGICTCNDEMDLNEDGEVLFFDPFTNMKFKTSKLAFLGAKYYLNRNFTIGCGAPLSMFYQFLGLEIPEEYMYAGWDMDDFRDDGYQWIDIDVVRSTEPDPDTGELYYIIQYEFEPGDNEYSYSSYPCGNPLDYYGSVVKNV